MPEPDCPTYLLRVCERCGMKHYVSGGYHNDYVSESGGHGMVAGYCVARS